MIVLLFCFSRHDKEFLTRRGVQNIDTGKIRILLTEFI
jgi:hypothetical protein